MTKVLIIAHLNPSYGSLRPVPLAKYLPQFGWQPVVLTPSLEGKPHLPFRVIETPYHDILALALLKKLFRINPNEGVVTGIKRRLGIKSERSLVDFTLRLGGEIIAYPDLCKGWKAFALRASEELMQREHIDAMISCMPVTSYIVASELKARYQIPWIVDLTDLWSQNHAYQYGLLRKLLDRRLEVKTLSQADALVTVSQPWGEKLRTLHKGKAVYVITHGFDPAEVNTPPVKLTSKFTITYTGTIYPGKQDPSKLFSALRNLISNGAINPNEIGIRFYGHKHDWLDKEIQEYGLANVVKQYGLVSRDIAVEKQRESHLLLSLKWEDPRESGWHSVKIFEYLGAKRPVLATGGSNDVITELLNETKAGISAPTVKDIQNTLKELYAEYKLAGTIAYKGEEAKINKYTHREMARKFSEVLDRVIQR